MDRDRDSDDDGAQHALTEEPENAARSHRSLGGPPSGFGWLQIVMRLIAPAAAALALVSVITNDTRLDADLALVAPGRAEPGSEIPLRALIYSGLNKPEGPALIHAGTRVELKAGDHKTLAQTVLRPGHGPSLEGALRIPSHASGALTLRAYAWAANERVEVERPLIIGAPIAVARAPRALGPLQQLAHGPIRTRPGAIAPSALTVRVAGGACVPEEPCELFVHIGTPAAVIEIAATPSITVEQAPAREPSSGVVGLRIRTHGPEADLELRAIGERAADAATGAASAVIAASRAVRLPIALGADAMQLEHAVLSAPAVPKLAMLGSSASGIADVFADDRWRSSATQRAGVLAPLRIAALEPGLYRVQMRRDPFESESAAVRTLYVRRPGESDGAVLRELAQRVVAHERTLPPDQRDAQRRQCRQRELVRAHDDRRLPARRAR